ncbi:hypothetical protein GIB67_031385 [Kingdonia uniflora]|uniref:Nitronate monooxygenase domain-containing protein n=1 Tax=Kingdonia uniflora TaxID=39325 RepID=A0A7J7MAZ6_9MAGN|nr:hypothetical protein GIB67_031385 [Kingdonia uniflora]
MRAVALYCVAIATVRNRRWCEVGSLEEAEKAVSAGVDAIIVQGHEAGGHVIGQDGLINLLPRVVDLVADRNVIIIAAGGIVDGRGYVAALSLGAHGICLGTRLVLCYFLWKVLIFF